MNRVATYRELDNDLLKQAAFLTLVSSIHNSFSTVSHIFDISVTTFLKTIYSQENRICDEHFHGQSYVCYFAFCLLGRMCRGLPKVETLENLLIIFQPLELKYRRIIPKCKTFSFKHKFSDIKVCIHILIT